MLCKEHAVVFTKNALYMEIIQCVQANLEATYTKAATISPSTDTSAEAQAAEKDRRQALARFEREIGTVDLTELTNGEVTDEFKVCMLTLVVYICVNCKQVHCELADAYLLPSLTS